MKNSDFNSTTPEKEVCPSRLGASNAIVATPNVQSQYKGTTRKIRLEKKCCLSVAVMCQMTNPLSTKKISTPKDPHRANGMWSKMTVVAARARSACREFKCATPVEYAATGCCCVAA